MQKFNPVASNSLGRIPVLRAVNPTTQVSHTFTAAGPRLDERQRAGVSGGTTFLIRTGKPGSYSWRWWNPCGGGPQGWMETMSQKGSMIGTITVSTLRGTHPPVEGLQSRQPWFHRDDLAWPGD
jgi:hypothetical protein